MRRILRFIFLKPVLWAAARFSSRPDPKRIFAALTELFDSILHEPGKKGLVIPFEFNSGKFIIFSDQHKGRRNGADDFMMAEPNYLAALDHYAREDFFFINLGDSEELWENSLWQVRKKNKATFAAEKKFIARNRYVKIAGNHDLYWNTSPLAPIDLQLIFGEKIKVYEGVILQTLVTNQGSGDPLGHFPLTIYLTHGHQGDAQSDGNWFSKFFVGWIWAPLQALLRINPNTPAYDTELKTLHNTIMYDWISPQPGKLLVTGHTHQPVFASLTHLERLYKQFQLAGQENNKVKSLAILDEIKKREKEFAAVALDYMNMRPTYFNTGCCCFSDGDITGIEISDGNIRLVKWALVDEKPERELLEEMRLADIAKR